ncbi:hypothetical protein DICVIV_06790 [Dictyocaulus viviparus]|uniref:Uncharacterized protein n=1 Tax=Dictyocaulus viviparus TaxID=29172 RepID=A0A0D8XTN8_DICVI|nr:hypothetical protein DICVIV_06790 [Dictyocaulus viviparus]
MVEFKAYNFLRTTKSLCLFCAALYTRYSNGFLPSNLLVLMYGCEDFDWYHTRGRKFTLIILGFDDIIVYGWKW